MMRDAAGCFAMAVMAKAPRAGAVKTRLTPPLSPAEAEALSASFLFDVTATLHVAVRGAPAAPAAPVVPFVAYAPADARARMAGMVAPGTRFVCADGEDVAEPGLRGIGRGLWQGARNLASMGFAAVFLVSADSPTLPVEILVQAARAMARPDGRAEEKVVLGPAEDGGYYLIGMRTPDPRLFQDIAWSTEQVAEETRARAADLGREVFLLPRWYDVDDGASLGRLAAALAAGRERAPRTEAALMRMGLLAGAAE